MTIPNIATFDHGTYNLVLKLKVTTCVTFGEVSPSRMRVLLCRLSKEQIHYTHSLEEEFFYGSWPSKVCISGLLRPEFGCLFGFGL